MTAGELLDKIGEIVAIQPFDATKVGMAVGLPVAHIPDESTPYFVVYRSSPPGNDLFAGYEMRVSADYQRPNLGMALLDIAPDQFATAEEVIARYGADNELALPTTRQPEDSPVYLVYRFPWGKLSFGFEPDLDGRLTSVVVDAIPER
jgi:GNAT superfamily N-acetyltransferase